MLPETVVEPLQAQINVDGKLHEKDIILGYGRVYIPNALA